MSTSPFTTTFLCLLAFACGAEDQETPVALADLPQVVKDAAVKAVPGIVLTEAEQETDNGMVIYEVEGVADGKTWAVELTAAGEVLEQKVEDEDEDEDDRDDDGKGDDDSDKAKETDGRKGNDD